MNGLPAEFDYGTLLPLIARLPIPAAYRMAEARGDLLYRLIDTPNGQLLQVGVPEPGTLVAWCIASLMGFAGLLRRRRSNSLA